MNSIQLLKQLAPLQLAKEHLPVDIINILEWLGKADNIPFNQLYYIAESCVDRYYTKVIETYVSVIKRQFPDCQLLLVNTGRCLKFLEEYADHQSQIWKIFQKHQTILEDLQDYGTEQPLAASTPRANSTSTRETQATDTYRQIIPGMSEHLYPTLIADGLLTTPAADNCSTLQRQITSEIDKYLQEAAEKHERDNN